MEKSQKLRESERKKRMAALKQLVACPRRMVVYAVFDVLEELHGSYEQKLIGDIHAEVEVDGKICSMAFAVTEMTLEMSVLHVLALPPEAGATEEEMELSAYHLLERILQHIEAVRKAG